MKYSWAVESFCYSRRFRLDSFFCVEFGVLGFVKVFAESYYFVRLDVLETILLIFVLVSVEVSAFW